MTCLHVRVGWTAPGEWAVIHTEITNKPAGNDSGGDSGAAAAVGGSAHAGVSELPCSDVLVSEGWIWAGDLRARTVNSNSSSNSNSNSLGDSIVQINGVDDAGKERDGAVANAAGIVATDEAVESSAVTAAAVAPSSSARQFGPLILPTGPAPARLLSFADSPKV